jgi:hypothetical protein
MSQNDFKTTVKEDDVYRTYRRVFKTVQETLDLPKIGKEANYLHSSRKSRKLYEHKASAMKVSDVLLQEMSIRSRLVELKVGVIANQELLESTISRTKKHLTTHYETELKELSTTVSGRSAVLAAIFAGAQDYLNQVSALNSQVDAYIKDIDAAGFTLTNVRELLKLQAGGRGDVL